MNTYGPSLHDTVRKLSAQHATELESEVAEERAENTRHDLSALRVPVTSFAPGYPVLTAASESHRRTSSQDDVLSSFAHFDPETWQFQMGIATGTRVDPIPTRRPTLTIEHPRPIDLGSLQSVQATCALILAFPSRPLASNARDEVRLSLDIALSTPPLSRDFGGIPRLFNAFQYNVTDADAFSAGLSLAASAVPIDENGAANEASALSGRRLLIGFNEDSDPIWTAGPRRHRLQLHGRVPSNTRQILLALTVSAGVRLAGPSSVYETNFVGLEVRDQSRQPPNPERPPWGPLAVPNPGTPSGTTEEPDPFVNLAGTGAMQLEQIRMARTVTSGIDTLAALQPHLRLG